MNPKRIRKLYKIEGRFYAYVTGIHGLGWYFRGSEHYCQWMLSGSFVKGQYSEEDLTLIGCNVVIK